MTGQQRLQRWAVEARSNAYRLLPTSVRRSFYRRRHPGELPIEIDSAEGTVLERLATRIVRSASGDDKALGSAVSPRDQGDSMELMSVALRASAVAGGIDMAALLGRTDDPELQRFIRRWPGEHYKLLAAIVEICQATQVVEIGTHRGLGAVAAALCAPTARPSVVTYDIVPYREFPGHVIRDDDPQIRQVVADLSDPAVFEREKHVLLDADLILMDGPKDNRFEKRFLDQLLGTLPEGRPCVMVFDDIRLLPMVGVWGGVSRPKFDATSLGHWSGTGLVALR